MRTFRQLAIAAAILTCVSAVVAPSSQAVTAPTNKAVEAALVRLKLPSGPADGVFDAQTQRGLCEWRELTGHRQSRALPSATERVDIINTTKKIIPKYMVVGLNINRTCQAMTWIAVSPTTKLPLIYAVYPVSTGRPSFPTATGLHTIYSTVNRWQESTLYPGAMMYRPMYFHGGMAIHGSAADYLVRTYPDSHGCVRALHKDIDKMWASGVGRGTKVLVYGTYVF